MSWFKRTKDPLVTDDYLQTAETVSRPMAIIYTIVMVFVVGALAFSLFFGGRWLYQNLDGSDKTKPTVVNNPITTTPPATTSGTNGSGSTAITSATTGQASQPAATTPTGGTTTNTTKPAATSSTSANQPATQTAARAIPATGPAETMAVFVAAIAIGVFGHQLYLRKRL